MIREKQRLSFFDKGEATWFIFLIFNRTYYFEHMISFFKAPILVIFFKLTEFPVEGVKRILPVSSCSQQILSPYQKPSISELLWYRSLLFCELYHDDCKYLFWVPQPVTFQLQLARFSFTWLTFAIIFFQSSLLCLSPAN